MTTNSDVTIFNLRIGADRREKLCATRIMGVSWYGTKGETVSDTDRRDKAKCVIRIPVTATVEAGKQYISEEKYKKLSDEEAERYWTIQKGAYIVRGQYVVAGQWLFDTFSFRQGIILKETIEELAKLRQHDEDFVTVTEYADNTIRGRIRLTIDSKNFYTNAGELSDEWTEFEFTSYATPSYFYTYFYNYVANTTVYITDVEILGYMSAYSESQLTILKDSIESEVKRATAQEGTLSSSIKQNAESITSKVSKGEMGSYITQYYNNVIIAFNKNSKYVQINPGEIAIYNYGVENSKKRAVFDQNGSHYWRDGYYVGKIGTNTLNSDNSKKGLNFDLEWPGAYMTWAAQDYSGASSYTMKWTYVQKNKGWSDYTAGRLHAGCDIDMHNWTLRNVSWPDGSINGTLRFVQIISMNSDGTAGQWSSNCLMQFKNGILIKGTWYG